MGTTILSFQNRVVIETLHNEGRSLRYIANYLGFSKTTIFNELHRLNSEYQAGLAQTDFERKVSQRGRKSSLTKNLKHLIEEKIQVQKWSPEQVAHVVGIAYKTVYNWIDQGWLDIQLPDLPDHGIRRHRAKEKQGKIATIAGIGLATTVGVATATTTAHVATTSTNDSVTTSASATTISAHAQSAVDSAKASLSAATQVTSEANQSLAQATSAVASASQSVASQTGVVASASSQVVKTGNALTSAQAAANEVTSANVTSAQTAVASQARAVDQASANQTSASAVVESAQVSVTSASAQVVSQAAQVASAQANLSSAVEQTSQAQAVVSAASTAVDHIQESASGASVTVTAAQANVASAQAAQSKTTSALSSAEKALSAAKSQVVAQEAAVSATQAALTKAQASAAANQIPSSTITLPAGYVAALKGYVKGTVTSDELNKIAAQGLNQFYDFQANAALSKVIVSQNGSTITLTVQEFQNLSLYAQNLINQIRAQFGTRAVLVTQSSLDYVETVVAGYNAAGKAPTWHNEDVLNAADDQYGTMFNENMNIPYVGWFSDEVTLNDLYYDTYQGIVSMLYADAHANWGHAKSLAGDLGNHFYDDAQQYLGGGVTTWGDVLYEVLALNPFVGMWGTPTPSKAFDTTPVKPTVTTAADLTKAQNALTAVTARLTSAKAAVVAA